MEFLEEMNKLKLVYIEWNDAFSSGSWHNKTELNKFANDVCLIKQIGWLYKETKTHIVLISRISFYIPDDEKGTEYGQLQNIPKTWIKKRKTIKL